MGITSFLHPRVRCLAWGNACDPRALQTSHPDYNTPCKIPGTMTSAGFEAVAFPFLPLQRRRSHPLSPRASGDQCIFQDVSPPETVLIHTVLKQSGVRSTTLTMAQAWTTEERGTELCKGTHSVMILSHPPTWLLAPLGSICLSESICPNPT